MSLKDYNPFNKEEDILPGKEQVEVTYSTNIGNNWSTEVTLGPEAEYVNVGFNYKPGSKNQLTYAGQIISELDGVMNKNKYQQMITDDIDMTNLWTDAYSFNLNNIPISFRLADTHNPKEYAVNMVAQRLYWYLSMQMLSESKSTTLNTQRNFCSQSDIDCIRKLKESIYIFPYLTASKLESTTNAVEYTEILSRPAVWETKE